MDSEEGAVGVAHVKPHRAGWEGSADLVGAAVAGLILVLAAPSAALAVATILEQEAAEGEARWAVRFSFVGTTEHH